MTIDEILTFLQKWFGEVNTKTVYQIKRKIDLMPPMEKRREKFVVFDLYRFGK